MYPPLPFQFFCNSVPAVEAGVIFMKEFDITKHDLVPRHELLNEQQREEVLKKFGIALRQLPRIIETDPMIAAIGGKPGDVVKITRKSETAGESVYYRIVIKGEKAK